jgi:hypothetical protein
VHVGERPRELHELQRRDAQLVRRAAFASFCVAAGVVLASGAARADPAPPVVSASASTSAAPPRLEPPPGLSAKRRLSDDDFARKKVGGYFTGAPLVAYDPLLGFGAGARVYHYEDGNREDPLFAYTPYLHRIIAQGFISTKGVQEHILDYDAPAVFGSLYRVRVTLEYDAAVAWPYFGTGARSMAPLSYAAQPGVTFGRMSDYQNATGSLQPDGSTYALYNVYGIRRPLLQLGIERLLLGGILRPFVGFNFSYTDLTDYTGRTADATAPNGATVSAREAPTLLARDCAAGSIIGCGGGWDNVLRLAISLDTRDFEPDPNAGVYAEFSNELASHAIGSQYDYVRSMLSVRGFYSPIPKLADLVVAVRGVYEVQSSGTPFFSMSLMPFIDDNHAGLGGLRTLRGYQQNRFVGPVMVLTNYELRWTFAHVHVLDQDFGLIAVPFVDMGRVFDAVRQTSIYGWARSEGMGFRVAWNEATVIMVDFGFSDEDAAAYINFNHIF